jgi:hypothetical protein
MKITDKYFYTAGIIFYCLFIPLVAGCMSIDIYKQHLKHESEMQEIRQQAKDILCTPDLIKSL